jgi:hypothetical protein
VELYLHSPIGPHVVLNLLRTGSTLHFTLLFLGLERGPLSLVRITEELLEWKSSCSGSIKPRLTAVGIRCANHATPTIS